MKKLSVYMRAFIVLLIVFFTVGLCTLGSVSTAGEALFVKANKAVYFSLVDEKGEANAKKIDSVYVKMGSAYNEVGTNFTLSIGLSAAASASTSSSNWSSANETKVTVTNVASQYSGKNGAQYNWFAGALDLSGKPDATQWQTLILSHMPLDWFAHNGRYIFHKILKAYITGGSYATTDGGVSCNFAGKNSAKIIGNIHGHIHNFLVRNIADGQPNTTENTIPIKRIATPEACLGRENSYNGQWDYNPFGESTSYPKTPRTAQDTTFCVYCIDLDTRTIKAICYGAGYDREVSY